MSTSCNTRTENSYWLVVGGRLCLLTTRNDMMTWPKPDYFYFYPPLSHNKVKTLTNSGLASDWRSGLVELDLSNNQLQVVQVVVFTGINNLTRLDLSNNQIHTLSQVVFTHHPVSTQQYFSLTRFGILKKNINSGKSGWLFFLKLFWVW